MSRQDNCTCGKTTPVHRPGCSVMPLWERPEEDIRTVETGVAIVVMCLSPDELATLEPFGSLAFEAIHRLIAKHVGIADPAQPVPTPPAPRGPR